MFGLPSFLLDPKLCEWQAKQRQEAVARRTAIAVAWNPQMKWTEEMNIKADTYVVRNLFDVQPTDETNPSRMKDNQYIVSSSGAWLYCVKRVKRGQTLETFSGSRRGTVMFDGPVLIPALHRGWPAGGWDQYPFMSLTPMEMMTLRTGTRMAKGSVIVVGLGLGHQLIEVSKRKQVNRLVLVEKSQDLVDWILPKIEPHLGRKLDEVVIGDAYAVMPKMQADVGLVDIFPSYGNNGWEANRFYQSCPNIKKIWCWGAAKVGER